MKTVTILILTLCFVSCKEGDKNKVEKSDGAHSDNLELIDFYKNDQAERLSGNIDWGIVSKNDEKRRKRVNEMIDNNLVVTAKDHYNASMVFQHGSDSTAYGMAVKMMKKAIELDPTTDKWLFAAATDRYLLSIDKPQIYGTQYQKMDDEPWRLGQIDTTQVTDAERIEHGVETLAQQREKVKGMNKKKLSELLNEGKSTDELISYIKSGNEKLSDYDISETGINSFSYTLMREGRKEDALKFFKLNTERNPQGWNVFDSYGECLLALGQKEKALIAYRKSLELNPKNTTALKIIEENK